MVTASGRADGASQATHPETSGDDCNCHGLARTSECGWRLGLFQRPRRAPHVERALASQGRRSVLIRRAAPPLPGLGLWEAQPPGIRIGTSAGPRKQGMDTIRYGGSGVVADAYLQVIVQTTNGSGDGWVGVGRDVLFGATSASRWGLGGRATSPPPRCGLALTGPASCLPIRGDRALPNRHGPGRCEMASSTPSGIGSAMHIRLR